MSDRGFPLVMRQRLRTFFLSNKTAQRRERQKEILDCMSPGLRGEVVMRFNECWMNKVSLLSHIERDLNNANLSKLYTAFIVDVSEALQFEAYAQTERFGIRSNLYIVGRGLVSRPPRLYRQGG